MILDYGTASLHERSDRWLRGFQAGTQRTYAFHVLDHLRWLVHVGRTESSVTLGDLKRYMGACGAEFAGPLGEPWLDEPLEANTLATRAAAIKSYYLHVCTTENINPDVHRALATTRLPDKAARNQSLLGHAKRLLPANPLAPTVPRRHPKLLPDGAVTALLEHATTARDRMIITWLRDGGVRAGELCGLHFSDLHLQSNHECGEMPPPHVHVLLRENNPNRARAKLGRSPELTQVRGGTVVRGGSIRRVSPAMVDTYYDYVTTDYHRVRSLPDHDLVLVALRNRVGAAFTVHGVEQMLARTAKRAGLAHVIPHSFRHTWATALYEGSDGDTLMIAQAGGWSSATTVETTYAHVSGSDDANAALDRVWKKNEGRKS